MHSVVGDEEEHRDQTRGVQEEKEGLRPEVAAENDIIEEFESEDEDNREEGEEAKERRGDCKHR